MGAFSLFLIPIGIILFFILLSSFFTVKQQTAAIVENFGKFSSIRNSGLQFKIPIVQRIAGRINLKIQQLDVLVETKTKDDVFVRLKISVQFQVIYTKVYDAFYKLQNPHDQITSYVFDVVRAEVPKMKLDDVFERNSRITQSYNAPRVSSEAVHPRCEVPVLDDNSAWW